MTQLIDVSVVIPTYNRCGKLRGAINSILRQNARDVRLEVLVVDNNSTDATREVVEAVISGSIIPVRYFFEPSQGVSFARNRGITNARGSIVAFIDDDIRAGHGWIERAKQHLDRNPHVAFIGGKVLPVWTRTPPSWLTREHWMPLGLLDYGDETIDVDSSSGKGLITANFAARRSALTRVGGFSPNLQRVKNGIGSMEDHELIDRLIQRGFRGRYIPRMVVNTEVDSERLRKAYHRRWHARHGGFYAIYREPLMERACKGRLFDTPAHLYRTAATDCIHWLKQGVFGRPDSAFLYETRLRFFAGFVTRRFRDYLKLHLTREQP